MGKNKTLHLVALENGIIGLFLSIIWKSMLQSANYLNNNLTRNCHNVIVTIL